MSGTTDAMKFLRFVSTVTAENTRLVNYKAIEDDTSIYANLEDRDINSFAA